MFGTGLHLGLTVLGTDPYLGLTVFGTGLHLGLTVFGPDRHLGLTVVGRAGVPAIRTAGRLVRWPDPAAVRALAPAWHPSR